MDIVLNSIPRLLGKKFVFSHISSSHRSRELSPALELLSKAGISHIITHTSGNGIPLASEENPGIFKVIFLDIALAQNLLGLDKKEWLFSGDSMLINKGQLAESFVGQELLCYMDCQSKPNLHYWNREKRGSMAEIDYLISIEQNILPIEVKSGTSGKLKSLNLFLDEKKIKQGISFSKNNYKRDDKIIYLPLYAVNNLFS